MSTAINNPNDPADPHSPRRLMYVADPSSIAVGILPDSVQPNDLYQWVDMLADAGVDIFVQDVCSQGYTVYWRSDQFQYDQRDQHRRFLPMLDAGTQPLQLLLDRSRERGMAFIAGFRMNDNHDFPVFCDFIESHPQWQLVRPPEANQGGKPLDFTFDEVRAFDFQIMAEVADRFDVDGLELTFRGPGYFPAPHGPQRAHLMTDLMRRLREMLDAHGKSRGKRLLLGARVIAPIEQCLELGLDVPTWIAERLIDYVSPQDTMYSDFNAGYAPFGDLTRDNPCMLYPGMNPWSSYRMRQKHPMTAPMQRALAHTFYNVGADGVSLFNHFVGHLWNPPFYPHALHDFRDLRDPNRVARAQRHYVFDPAWGGVPWFGMDRNPYGVLGAQRVILDRAADNPSGVFRFNLYEHMDHVRAATLLVRGPDLTQHDQLDVKLNDTPLSLGPFGRPDPRPREHCPDTRWFALPPDAPAFGDNHLTITLVTSDPNASGDLILDEVEVFVQPR